MNEENKDKPVETVKTDETNNDNGDNANKDTQVTDDKKDAETPKDPAIETPEKILEIKTRKKLFGEEDNSGEGEPDLDNEDDEKIISKVVDKRLEPFVKAQEEKELSDFLTANPEFKPYETTIKKYAQHPAYKNADIEVIAYGIAGKDLMRIGAEKAAKANEKIKGSQVEDTTTRPKEETQTKKSVWDMTPAEFEEYKNSIKYRK